MQVRSTSARVMFLMTWLIELISIGLRAATGSGAIIEGGRILVALKVVICDFSFNLLYCYVILGLLLQLKLCKDGLCVAGGQSQR